MFLVFSINHFRESNRVLKDIIYNDDNLCLKKAEFKEKTPDRNLSLPIKNPHPLLKNGFRIRIANHNFPNYQKIVGGRG